MTAMISTVAMTENSWSLDLLESKPTVIHFGMTEADSQAFEPTRKENNFVVPRTVTPEELALYDRFVELGFGIPSKRFVLQKFIAVFHLPSTINKDDEKYFNGIFYELTQAMRQAMFSVEERQGVFSTVKVPIPIVLVPNGFISDKDPAERTRIDHKSWEKFIGTLDSFSLLSAVVPYVFVAPRFVTKLQADLLLLFTVVPLENWEKDATAIANEIGHLFLALMSPSYHPLLRELAHVIWPVLYPADPALNARLYYLPSGPSMPSYDRFLQLL